MTRRVREEIAWGLAVLATGLFCLVLLPFLPLALLFAKVDEVRGRR